MVTSPPYGCLQTLRRPVPAREKVCVYVLFFWLREECTPLTLLMVLQARAAVLLLLSGLQGVVRDVMVGAVVGVNRGVVMVVDLVWGVMRAVVVGSVGS